MKGFPKAVYDRATKQNFEDGCFHHLSVGNVGACNYCGKLVVRLISVEGWTDKDICVSSPEKLGLRLGPS